MTPTQSKATAVPAPVAATPRSGQLAGTEGYPEPRGLTVKQGAA
jgi:hypothetical protein